MDANRTTTSRGTRARARAVAGAGARTGEPVAADPWAARLSVTAARAVASLRLRDDVRAHVESDQLWLRGDRLDDELDRALQHLAPNARFTVQTDGSLVPQDHLLPHGELPTGEWAPLDELLELDAPPAALTAAAPSPVAVHLVRSDRERPATLLLTTLRALADYANTAPDIRLRALSIACDGAHVLVRASPATRESAPLPPLPGRHHYEDAGLIVPCGWAWSPPVDAATLRAALAIADDELALFADDGTWRRIAASSFVHARRSAVRLTVQGAAR